MARKKKPSGRLRRGPFTADDIRKALMLGRWELESQTRHENYRHPIRPGKAQVDEKWTAVEVGSFPWKGLLQQTGYTKQELLLLLNGIAVDDD